MLNINKILKVKNNIKGKNNLVSKSLMPSMSKLKTQNNFEGKIGSMSFSKIVNNITPRSKPRQVKGASTAKQNQWKTFSPQKRNLMRAKYKDTDGDRIPNRFDCSPKNVMKQDWDLEAERKRGQYIEHISPDEYLKLTNTNPYEDGKLTKQFSEYYDDETGRSEPLETLGSYIEGKEKKIDLPFVGHEPGDHEGRHRALAAKAKGHKTIPVVRAPPKSWRTEEVFDDWFGKRFPTQGERYKEQWKKRFDRPFPTEQMDKQSTEMFTQVIKEKGLDKQQGASEEKQKEWKDMPTEQRNEARAQLSDKDGDRVPDEYDCEPQNAMAQDSKPNKLMRERIDKLNILFGEIEEDDKGTITKYTEIEDNKRRKALSRNLDKTFKTYPGLLSDVEQGTKKNIVVSDKHKVDGTISFFEDDAGDVQDLIILNYDAKSKKKPDHRALIMRHEIQHSKQMEGMDLEERDKHLATDQELDYEKRPTEIEAQKEAYKMLGRHDKIEGFEDYYGRVGEHSFKKRHSTPEQIKEQQEELDELYDSLEPEANKVFREGIRENINIISEEEEE